MLALKLHPDITHAYGRQLTSIELELVVTNLNLIDFNIAPLSINK